MKIIKDACNKLGVPPQEFFTMAVAMMKPEENPQHHFNYYLRTNTIPEFVLDFCLDTLVPKKAQRKVAA